MTEIEKIPGHGHALTIDPVDRANLAAERLVTPREAASPLAPEDRL